MLIFQGPKRRIVYIHIPKNSGKYIRSCIKNKYKIIKAFWDVGKIDRAHIPYSMRHIFIKNPQECRYITFVRNPYDRFISAFKYKFPKKSILMMQTFIKDILPTYQFDKFYNPNIIHFYPQYLFLTNEQDEEWDINNTIEVTKLENAADYKFIRFKNFNLTKYKYTEYFDNECISILNKIYEKDFMIFHYPIIQHLQGCIKMNEA
jgi:hypothetical protein